MDFESWLRSTFNACYFNWYQCQYIRLFSSFHFRSRFVRCFRQKKTKNTIFEMNSSVVFRVWYKKKNQTKNKESTNCIQWKALQGWFVSTVCNFVSGEKESQKKQKERQKKNTPHPKQRDIRIGDVCTNWHETWYYHHHPSIET